jgi:hypothetical protein
MIYILPEYKLKEQIKTINVFIKQLEGIKHEIRMDNTILPHWLQAGENICRDNHLHLNIGG